MFDALPLGAKMQCKNNGNLYQKTGANEFICIKPSNPYTFSNRPDGFWSSLFVYKED